MGEPPPHSVFRHLGGTGGRLLGAAHPIVPGFWVQSPEAPQEAVELEVIQFLVLENSN